MRKPSALANKPLQFQVDGLFDKYLSQNYALKTILERTSELRLPAWYLGAGCIAQTVWNIEHGFKPESNIKDYDLVYYDPSDTSFEAEDKHTQQAKKLFADLSIEVDLINQARVHLWYKEHFGYPIPPYTSCEDAINTWPTTTTAIGIRKLEDGKLSVYAPFGLNDLFSLIVRPNKRQITEEVYQKKVDKWTAKWPQLTITDWHTGKPIL